MSADLRRIAPTWVVAFVACAASVGCTATQEASAPGDPVAPPEPTSGDVAGGIKVEQRAIDANAAVVISQVYGGGGNTNAVFQNDFVELFNRSTGAVSLNNLTVQYASNTGAFGFVTPVSGTLQPGQYYLVWMAAGAGNGVPLPTQDASGVATMSANQGKVALVNDTVALPCGTTADPCTVPELTKIIDLVGYGSANLFEGAAAGTLANPTAAIRAGAGCTDSNTNNADFVVATPTPRNTASPFNPCSGGDSAPSVISTMPPNGATNIATSTAITIAFSEPVTATGSWFTFSCTTSGSVAATVTGGPSTFTLTPAMPLANTETCTITVTAPAITDVDLSDPPDTMAADFMFSFTTVASQAPVPIHFVQGATHTSPVVNQLLTAGPAIVTALASNGFYMQDPAPDADDATSEGIFVFTSTAPAVAIGDEVTVRGTVSEFRPGGDVQNLTITEVTGPMVTINAHGQPLPAPAVLGTGPGERHQPNTIIDNDATGNVETSGVFDPGTDGVDFLESLEGMRVQLDNPVAVGPTKTFSGGSIEIAVVGEGGADASPRTPRGGVIIGPGDFNPERVIIANGLTTSPALPTVNVGDSFTGAIVGVVNYSFANYKLLVSGPIPAPTSGGITPEVSPLVASSPGQLSAASLNVENLDPSDPPAKFARLAGIVVTNLRSPDIIAVEEIQDNTGATNDGVVDANLTLDMFVAAITVAGGPAYSYRQINPQNNQDGGEPGGNIRVAIMYRTDRGLAFVDRPGGGPTTANAVTGGPGVPQLAFSPGRIDPTNTAFSSSRKPLAAELTFLGKTLFVVANHFNSKGGDDPLFGRFQPPVLSSETQRQQQANVEAAFVAQILALDPSARVLLLGDFNDFQFSNPVNTLRAAGFTVLVDTLPASERYSYVFDGNSQTLDHIMVSNALAPVATYDVVHVNAEFADQASDHDPAVVRLQLGAAAVPALPHPAVAALAVLLALVGWTLTTRGRRPR